MENQSLHKGKNYRTAPAVHLFTDFFLLRSALTGDVVSYVLSPAARHYFGCSLKAVADDVRDFYDFPNTLSIIANVTGQTDGLLLHTVTLHLSETEKGRDGYRVASVRNSCCQLTALSLRASPLFSSAVFLP